MAVRFIVSPQDEKMIGTRELTIIAEVYSQSLDLPELSVELSLASMDEIQELNLQYRDLDEPTDVLSFQLLSGLKEVSQLPAEANALLGSVIICPQKASLYGETLPQLVHHGLLHILGFDHEQDMASWVAQEDAILKELTAAALFIPAISQ